MRFLILCLLFVSPAIAQSNRDLADLMWIPQSGARYGHTSYIFEGSQVNIDKDTEQDNLKQNFVQVLGYGFTDALSANFTYRHQAKGETSTKPGATGDNRDYINELGGKNPRLGGIWRVKEQAEGGNALDIHVGYAPDLVDRDVEEDDTDVNAAEGGQTVDVGVRWGAKSEKRQWSLEGNLTWQGERETTYDDGDVSTEDAKYVLEGAYNWQAFMLSFLQFRSRLSLSRTSGYDIDNEFTNSESEVDPVWRGLADATFVWSPWKDIFVIETGVSLFRDYDYDVDVDGNNAEYKDSKGYKIHLSALYQF